MRSIIICFLISIFLLLFCDRVIAKDLTFNIGASILYANISDPKFKLVDEYDVIRNPFKTIGSLNTGITKSFDKINITLQTNRLINFPVVRLIADKKTGAVYHNKTRLFNDTILVGYRINRFVPSLFASKIRLSRALYYKGDFRGKKITDTFLYGVNFGYLLTKKTNVSLMYIAPQKDINLDSAFGLTFNYLF